MSKLFFDNLIAFEEIELVIKKSATSLEERDELWHLVDEILNHKVLKKVLDKLPKNNHQEFLALFHKCPHDEFVIFEYLNGKTGRNIEKELQAELKGISSDILQELGPHDEITAEIKISKK